MQQFDKRRKRAKAKAQKNEPYMPAYRDPKLLAQQANVHGILNANGAQAEPEKMQIKDKDREQGR